MPATAHQPTIRRREALLAAGGAIGAAYGLQGLLHPREALSAGCVLQREVTEGPYYLDLDLVRRNVREGRAGTPLTLKFIVVDAATCKVIKGAAVEIWHTDAAGKYSGIASEGTTGKTFMRGVQKTGSSGLARFETVFPGWYSGRTPHIHIKVFVAGEAVHTGQVFFRPAVTKTVYRQGTYAKRGAQDVSNATDGIYQQAGSNALLALKRKGSAVSGGYTGSITLGVDQG